MDRGVFPQEADLLRRIAQVHQNAVAEATGLSTTMINGVVAGQKGLTLPNIGPFLQALGYTINQRDGEQVTVSRHEYEALKVLARQALDLDER